MAAALYLNLKKTEKTLVGELLRSSCLRDGTFKCEHKDSLTLDESVAHMDSNHPGLFEMTTWYCGHANCLTGKILYPFENAIRHILGEHMQTLHATFKADGRVIEDGADAIRIEGIIQTYKDPQQTRVVKEFNYAATGNYFWSDEKKFAKGEFQLTSQQPVHATTFNYMHHHLHQIGSFESEQYKSQSSGEFKVSHGKISGTGKFNIENKVFTASGQFGFNNVI